MARLQRDTVRRNDLGWRIVRRGTVSDYRPPVRIRDQVSRLAPVILAVTGVAISLHLFGPPEQVWGLVLYVLVLAVAGWASWVLTPVAIRVRADGHWIGTGDFRLRSSGRKVAIGVSQDGPKHWNVFVSFPRQGRMITAWRSDSRADAIEVASEMRVLVGQSPLRVVQSGDTQSNTATNAADLPGDRSLHNFTTHARGHMRRPID
ncbi:MAG: hypothetical protein ACOC0P_01255 [Planctomycetota bacterium]